MQLYPRYKKAHAEFLELLRKDVKSMQDFYDNARDSILQEPDPARRVIKLMEIAVPALKKRREAIERFSCTKKSPLADAAQLATMLAVFAPFYFILQAGAVALGIAYGVAFLCSFGANLWVRNRQDKRAREPFAKQMDNIIADCNAEVDKIAQNELAAIEASPLCAEACKLAPALSARFEAVAKAERDFTQNLLDADKVALKEEIKLPPKIRPKHKTSAPQPKKAAK